jgi:hypothetical protein
MKNAIITYSDMAINYHDALDFFILHRKTHKEQMVIYNNKEIFLLFSAGFYKLKKMIIIFLNIRQIEIVILWIIR